MIQLTNNLTLKIEMEQEDKIKGLYQKYVIRKIVGYKQVDGFLRDYRPSSEITERVDIDSEYFVMRLDKGGKDKVHINACRKAIIFYANEIKDHLPELSKDLIEKYSEPLT